MKLTQRRNIRIHYLGLAFAIPFFGMLFVMLISQYEPFGKYSMLYSDMYHQYYPFFVAYRDALRSGKGLMYTWSVGLGMDYPGLIAYYLASPLYLLSVFVPEGWLLEFFSLLMPVKLGLASVSFSLFLNRIFRKKDLSVSLFGSFYGLCAWALGYQWNIMWLDTFALLPLVVLGTVYLLRDRKCLLYTLSLFLAITANYYIGLFVCIFVFLLFFVYEICRWKGFRRFLGDFVTIGVFSLLAIGMTTFLTVPALGALQDTQSVVNKFPQDFRLNIAGEHNLKGLFDAMRQVAGNMGGSLEPTFKEGLPNLYCGVGSLLLGILYLMLPNVKLRDKLCAVGLLLFFNVSFIIRQLDYIWHGFHFTNMIPYRFSFLHSFVLLYMAYRAWLNRRRFEPLQILAAAFLTGSLLACSNDLMSTRELSLLGLSLDIPVYIIYNGGFLALYTLFLLYGQQKITLPEDADEEAVAQHRLEEADRKRWSRLLAMAVMGSELIAMLVSFGLYFPGTNVKNYPKGTEGAASMIRYMKEREEDNLFYRAEVTHSQTLNDGALNGYNGISAFTSSANVSVTEFMRALGYGAKNTYNRYCYEESSPVSNLFLGIRYMLDRDSANRSSTYFTDLHHYEGVHLLENRAYLPLGFLAMPELESVVFDNSDGPFVFQNELFRAATGVHRDPWHHLEGENLTITGNGVKIRSSNDWGYCSYSDCESGSDVTYTYIADRDGFFCINLNLPKRNTIHISVNGVELYRETISLPQMLAGADVKAGNIIEVRIECAAGESSTMELTAAVLDEAVFWEGYAVLAASQLELTDFKSTRVEGNIQCVRDGLLYTSIPQNGNWFARVDGEAVETTKVGDCMVAIPMTMGEHRVVLYYRNPHFSLGWKISLGCAGLLTAAFLLWERPKRKKQGKFEK